MDLIAFCHIKWNFVYQRPQHLLNRFALHNRVFIVEEPLYDQNASFLEITQPNPDAKLWVVQLHLAKAQPQDSRFHILKSLMTRLLQEQKINRHIAWYYSPMALEYSDHLRPQVTIYDCMDELSAFLSAPPRLRELEQVLLEKADVVFTGGKSLYEAKKHLHRNIHAFPSSIDKSHFATARKQLADPLEQAFIPRPRLGFYGVIDERFNTQLVEELATARPSWQFILIGPVVKINPQKLPRRNNIHYLGGKDYQDLPGYLSNWDIAIMPFALNESTKFISPTKTPEFLAGGKPVISTSIADVVDPYGKLNLVYIADTTADFISAAEEILQTHNREEWLTRTDAFLAQSSWDHTWNEMARIIDVALENNKIKNDKRELFV